MGDRTERNRRVAATRNKYNARTYDNITFRASAWPGPRALPDGRSCLLPGIFAHPPQRRWRSWPRWECLRRQGGQVDELSLGNTALDLSSCTLICGENSVRLSAKEFDIMRFLLQSKDAVLSKEVILAKVWGYDSNAVENHVEVYVGFLRKKLAAIGSNVRIEAVRRLGYRLEVDESC